MSKEESTTKPKPQTPPCIPTNKDIEELLREDASLKMPAQLGEKAMTIFQNWK